jgi:DnaJ-class molecular chaperone
MSFLRMFGLNMMIQVNCPECQGTGGLYDHSMGIDDECGLCEGNRTMILEGREVPLDLFTKINTLDVEVRKKGIANYILGWEEHDCPCCHEKLNFRESEDGRSVDVLCSNEDACMFEIIQWPA